MKDVKAEPITVVEAIAHLLLPPALDEVGHQVAEAIWTSNKVPVVPANQRVDVRKLRAAADSIRSLMDQGKLAAGHKMLLALWIRFFLTSVAEISPDALRWIEHERLVDQRKRPRLYQLRDDKAKTWTGPRVRVDGLKPCFGWTFLEMILAPFSRRPYRAKWRIVELEGASADKRSARSPRKSSAGQRPDKRPARTKRVRMSEEGYRRIYGTGLIDKLKKACARDARSGDAGILTKDAPSGRPFLADRPAKYVVKHLQTTQANLLSGCAASTLQGALSLWVECPRGRPQKGQKMAPAPKPQAKVRRGTRASPIKPRFWPPL